MANDSRSGRKNKGNADSSSKGKQTNAKGATRSSSTIPETSGLRRSTRETSSKRSTNSSLETTPKKNVTSSPSSTRKSERLEKQTATTPPVQKKSEKVEKQISRTPPVQKKAEKVEQQTPTTHPVQKKSEKVEKQTRPVPLRRSERGKNSSPSCSSASKKSDKSLVSPEKQKKEKKEKSVRQLTMETSEVCSEPLLPKRKTMNARKFMKSFKPQSKKLKAKDCGEELNVCNSSQDYSRNHIDGSGEEANGHKVGDSEGSEFAIDLRDNAERTEKNCLAKEGFQSSESKDSTAREKVAENGDSLGTSPQVLPSKRKRNETIADSNSSAVVAKQAIGVSDADVITSSPSEVEKETCVKTCGTCSGRQRVDNGSRKQELCSCQASPKENLNEKSLDTSTVQDSRELEARAIAEPPAALKDQMQHKDHAACGGKLNSFKYEEYWVPVQMSNIQLEQYCATLHKNSLLLCSSLKNKDLVGTLQDILLSARKCCDHPYLVDKSLQSLLIKDLKPTEILDVGIKASGKLQLLDRMLSEFKSRGLRVLIYFQHTGGSGSGSIADILDDFLRQRFGSNSYERVDGNLQPSKKQSALNSFNNESGRFVFLLETRACLPSIKLSSVDAIIIYGGDWNPVGDVRALQKIALGSRFKKVKIFRLYSYCTLEEKLLILSKQQDKVVDGNLQNMSRSTTHRLLMWGASCLFKRLDEFHGGNLCTSNPCNSIHQSHLEGVTQQFLTILSQIAENNSTSKLDMILGVKQNRGTYFTYFPLFGESITEVMDEGAPNIFWAKLLEGKHPSWKYISASASSQRSRKRVQYLDSEALSGETVKRQKKVMNDVEMPSVKPGLEGRVDSRIKEGTPAGGDIINENRASTHDCLVNDISETPRQSCDLQNSIHLLIWPETARLCEVLQLKEDVKDTVEKFHEFVITTHRISREPKSLLQAFQISVCWTAASILRQKINHNESLALAKQHLNFNCKAEEAEAVYVLLEDSKKEYKKWVKKDCSPSRFPMNVKGIQKRFQKKMDKLHQMQQEEKKNIIQNYNEKKAELEKQKRTEAAVIRLHNHNNILMQTERLKILESEFAKQFDELDCERELQLKDLKARYVADMNKLHEKEASQLEALQVELSSKSPSSESGCNTRVLHANEQLSAHNGQQNNVPASCHLPKRNNSEQIDLTLRGEAVTCGNGSENVAVSVGPSGKTDGMGVVASEEVVAGAGEPISSDNPENVVSMNLCSNEQNFDGASLKLPNGQIQLGVSGTGSSSHGPQNAIPEMCSAEGRIHDGAALGINMDVSSSDEQIHDRGTESMPGGEVPPGVADPARSGCPENAITANGPSSEERISKLATSTAGEVRPENVISGDDLGNVGSVNPLSSREQIPDRAIPCMLSVDTSSAVPEGSGGLDASNTIRENDEACVTSDNATRVEQHHIVGHDLHSPQQSLEISSSVQTPTTITQGGLTPSNEALEDVCLEPTSTRTHDGDTAAREMQTASDQVEHPLSHSVGVESDRPNQDKFVTEPSQTRPLTSTDRSTSHNPPVPDMPSVSGIECQSSSQHQNAQTPTATLEQSAVPNSAVSQTLASLAQNSAVDTHVHGSQTNISGSRTASINPGNASHTIQVTPPVVPRLPSHLTQDPLQHELERLRKEINDTIKTHEDRKNQLKTDCEREIEEAVSRVRRKFDSKLQETQAEFLVKKNKLDTIHNKVLMNRILADAFRSKCMDIRAPGSGTQQENPSSFIQHMVQAQRSSILSGPSLSAPPPSTIGPTITTPAISVHTTPHNAASPLHTFHPSSERFSNSPIRPPHISNIPSSPSVNHQVGSGFRAPAPHLQPFRHSVPAPSTNLPSTGRLPSQQQVSSNSSPLLPRPQLPTYQSGSQIRAHHQATLSNSSQSALELLMDVGNRPGVNLTPPTSVPAQSDLSPCSGSSAQPQPGPRNTPVNPAPENGVRDVVCISDDED